MQDLLDKLIILNDIERPCMYLVCREFPDGKIIYVNEYLRRRYPKLRKSEGWACLSDYGFIFNGKEYVLRNKSIAKYPDGTPKKWQGRTHFTYNDIRYFDGRSSDEGLF